MNAKKYNLARSSRLRTSRVVAKSTSEREEYIFVLINPSFMSWHSRTSSPSQLWRLRTTTFSVAIAFSAWLLIACSLVQCTKSSHYLLSQSEHFNKLVQCIKYKRGLSGHECFLAHKDELLTELKENLTKAGYKYLVRYVSRYLDDKR